MIWRAKTEEPGIIKSEGTYWQLPSVAAYVCHLPRRALSGGTAGSQDLSGIGMHRTMVRGSVWVHLPQQFWLPAVLVEATQVFSPQGRKFDKYRQIAV
jgi:hypothetical protein